MTEYPKYDPYGTGGEWCYELYAKKLNKLKKQKKNYKYPLKKDSLIFQGYYHDFSPHRCIVSNITPKKYMSLVLPKAHIRQCSINYLFDSFEGKNTLDPLYLEIDKCRVVRHEGRHRAEISDDLNIEEVPVAICYDYGLVAPYSKAMDYDNDKENNGYSYEKLMKFGKENWKMPENCSINDIKPEKRTSDPFFWKEPLWKIKEKHKELRKKYGLE